MKEHWESRPANRTVRVEDVAREAGVSPITVSRTLSNPEKVKEETRKKVTDAVAKTGYVLNSFASILRSGRSSIVSVFISSLQDQHFADAIQGCADALEGSSYHLMMAQTGCSGAEQESMLEQVLPFRPAAVMFAGIVKSEQARTQLRALNIPVVEMWDYRPDPVDMLVGFSNAEGGRLMGTHFGQSGFRRIAYAGRTDERGTQRLEGFREGLSAFGRDVDYVLPIEGRRAVGEGMDAFDQIRAGLPGCDAIFFGTDVLAVGALFKARQIGIDVPGEIAMAGYGDLDIARQLFVPLTTVHVSSYHIGHTAGQMMRQRLNHEQVAERVVRSPIHLVVRESTGARVGLSGQLQKN